MSVKIAQILLFMECISFYMYEIHKCMLTAAAETETETTTTIAEDQNQIHPANIST